jgi:3-hydroxyisobutyrate dehydrogenase
MEFQHSIVRAMNTHHTIGFIGFGVMGSGMARNVAHRGHSVLGYSRSPHKVEALVSLGIIPASREEIANRCGTIILSLTDGAAVHSFLFGEQGIAPNLQRGSLVIDTTTIAPSEAARAHEKAAEFGIEYIDAPVTGGDIGARNGTLTIMCGGTTEAYARALPILECIGAKIVRVGGPGFGQRLKAVNQVAVALGIVAMTEAIVFSESQGIDPAFAIETIQGGAAGSWALSNYAPRIFKGELGPGFSAEHMLKDLRIALGEAHERCQLPGTELSADLFEKLTSISNGFGNHALLKAYRDNRS